MNYIYRADGIQTQEFQSASSDTTAWEHRCRTRNGQSSWSYTAGNFKQQISYK